jgi:hypothetical protein
VKIFLKKTDLSVVVLIVSVIFDSSTPVLLDIAGKKSPAVTIQLQYLLLEKHKRVIPSLSLLVELTVFRIVSVQPFLSVLVK